MIINQDIAKTTIQEQLKKVIGDFCDTGALVSITVDMVDYTGVFYPNDKVFENVAGASAYRDLIDSGADPVEVGTIWYTKDAAGNRVSIPITEALAQKIKFAVSNWGIKCSRVYNERVDYMLSLDDATGFDPVIDMETHLPSRNITIT